MKKPVLASLAVFLVAVGVFSLLYFHTPGLLEFDGYFHTRMGRMVLEKGILHRFPWMFFTFQRDHYADPYLLFHIYLGFWIKLLPLDPLVAAKLAMLVLIGLIALMVFRILRTFDPKRAWLGMALLAAMASGRAYQRLVYVRPHVLSILLLLAGIWAILRKKWRLLAAVSFAYAYSYSAPHLLTVVALAASAVFSLTDKRPVWRPFVYSLGGLAAGLILNPYFPYDIKHLYLLTFKMALFRMSAPPAELMPLSSWQLLSFSWASFLAIALAILAVSVSAKKLSARSLFLFATAGIFFVLLMRAYRFAEYWPFVATLAVAAAASEVVVPAPLFGRLMKKAGAIACLGTLLAVGALEVKAALGNLAPVLPYPSLKEVMDVLDREAAPGDIVFTDNWAMTTPMFYITDKVYYLLMLDPQTMSVSYPGLYLLWNAIDSGQVQENALPLVRAIEARVKDPEIARLRTVIESGAVLGRLPDIIKSAFHAKWLVLSHNQAYAGQDLRPLISQYPLEIQFVKGNDYFSLYRLR